MTDGQIDAWRFDYWYDWNTRLWVVQKKDREGNQIGEAAYFHSRKEAEQMVKEAK